MKIVTSDSLHIVMLLTDVIAYSRNSPFRLKWRELYFNTTFHFNVTIQSISMPEKMSKTSVNQDETCY